MGQKADTWQHADLCTGGSGRNSRCDRASGKGAESGRTAEELGDLLLQVMLQSRLAEEEGYFTVEDVVEDISRKMIRRHPHVFGETVTASDGQPLKEWGQIKAWEKQQMTYQEDPRRKKRRKKLVRILDRLLSL